MREQAQPGHLGRNELPGHDDPALHVESSPLPSSSEYETVSPCAGLLTYFAAPKTHYAMDGTYKIVDTWEAGNGYTANSHDLQLLPNGHALILSYDPQPVRMDSIVPGGDPDAIVIGLIIQELDTEKNVVFQWRSWDHFEILDSVARLTTLIVDYVHGNALELDHDGHILLSSRHLNEITKIDRQTGDVIWRMGLNAVQNVFNFVNDPRGFSFQHDIRRLPDGHITLFDNGLGLSPLYSRALEYELDETKKVATLVWEFRNSPDIYGYSLGNTQRRASGGTMIGWGSTPDGVPRLTDLHADGSKALELGLDPNTWSYRAFRFPWRTTRFTTSEEAIDFGGVEIGNTASAPLTITNTSTSQVTLTCFFTTDSAFSVPASTPMTLDPGLDVSVYVEFSPTLPGEFNGTLYVRSQSDTDLVAQPVELTGVAGVLSVDDTLVAFRLYESKPNPLRSVTRIRYDLPRASKVVLEVFDVSGRRVETLENAFRAPGRYEARWNAKGMRSGLYFYRLTAGGHTATRKFSLLN